MVTTAYNDGFKARMIQRLTGPEATSATALSRETGVSQATLSKWLREARKLVIMKNETEGRAGRERRPGDWTIEEKMKAVVAANAMSESELGEFLRKEGLHEAQIEEWRDAIRDALGKGKSREGRSKAASDAREISNLKKEILRKDRALAEVTALLALRKKLEEIWGDEDDGTASRRET